MKSINAKSKPNNRKLAVLKAAELFLRKGYSHTSMDEVVKESRVSKSNIYYHFTSKEELALAVAEHWIEQHETMLTSLILQTNRSAEERMLEIFHALSDDLRDRSCQGGCPFLSLYMQTHSSTVRTRIRRFFSEQIPLIEQLLKQGMASNEFRSDLSVKETASLFISTIEGALMMAETSGDPQVVCETGQAMLRLLLKP